MQRLTDQAYLITGSTRGIGLAIARRLLDEGAIVGIHGRDAGVVETLAQQLHAERAIPVAADLSDPAQAAELVDRFHSEAGRIDGCVNNAGSGAAVAFRGLTPESWRQTFALNVDAAFACAQRSYVLMRKQKRGGIVNIASLAAHGPGKWMGADYAASKAALVSMTRSLALEAARFGIRCNAVSPGFVETDMTAAIPPAARENLGVPLGRLGQGQDVAAAVAFLLSDDAAYMTGQVLHVDGGLWMGD